MAKIISISVPDEIITEANKYIPRNKRSKAIVRSFSLYLKLLKKKKIDHDMKQMFQNFSSNDLDELYEINELDLQLFENDYE